VRLAAYKVANGECNVPNHWAEDRQLAQWVITQRWSKRNLDHGKPNARMTVARVIKLAELGFEWERPGNGGCKEPQWDSWLAQLAAYKAQHGHCNVPYSWPENPQLGKWAGRQRTNKKEVDRGERAPHMSAERVAKLNALGFEWVL
jgi:hypothetical protein